MNDGTPVIDPVTYRIEIDTKEHFDLNAYSFASFWFSKLTLECSPPAHFNVYDKTKVVAEMLQRMTILPYRNLVANEGNVDTAREEWNKVMKKFYHLAIEKDKPFVYDDLFLLKVTVIGD